MSEKKTYLGIVAAVLMVGLTIGLVFSFYSVKAADALATTPETCTPPNASDPDPGASGLIAYWPLDENEGATTFDDVASVAGHDGTCSGDTCPTAGVTGIAGQAADFLAADKDVIEVADHADFDFAPSDKVSVGLWVKTTQICADEPDNKVFFGRYRIDDPTNGSWWVGCVPDNEDSTKGLAAFHLRDSDNVVGRAVGTSKINDGEWHYLVGVRDGSNDKNHIYVDGVLEDTVESPGYTGVFNGDDDLTMGAYHLAGPGYHYQGVLDEVTFYGRELNSTEIGDYHDTCNPPNTPPIVGDVDFETDINTPLEITEAQLLANSSDPDVGDTLSVDSVAATSNQGGLITGFGPWTYSPPADYSGSDSFTFSVTDGTDSTPGTANIEVNKLIYYLPIVQK
jgi:hypothetical protein